VSAEDPRPRRWGTPASVLAAVVAIAAMRVVAVAGLSSLLLRPHLRAFKVSRASWLLPRRSCTGAVVAFPSSCVDWWMDVALPRPSVGFSLPCGGWWADASPSWCADDAQWLALRRQDAKLSACCTTVCWSSGWISCCARRPLGVVGSRSRRSKATTMAMFWLALAKHRSLLSSSMILRCVSRARTHILSWCCMISSSGAMCSSSRWSHMVSSSYCHSLSWSIHWQGGTSMSAVAPCLSAGCRGVPFPMRGAIVGTRDMPFGGHLAVRVINDVCHETFA
jgi:hypothetical protein